MTEPCKERKGMAPMDILKNWFSSLRNLRQNGRRLASLLVGENRSLVYLYSGSLLVLAALPFIQQGLFGLTVNEAIAPTGTFLGVDRRYAALAGVILCMALLPIFRALQGYARKMFRFFLNKKIQSLFMEKRSELDVATHENPARNDVYVRVSENHWRMENFLDRHLYMIQDIVEVVIAATILVGINWRVGLLIFLGTVPELLVGVVYGRDVWGIYGGKAEIRRRYHDAVGRFNHLPALIELKLYELQEYFSSLATQLLESFQLEEKRAERRKLLMQFLALIVSYGTLGLGVFWFFADVVRGFLQVGTFVFIMGSIEQFNRSAAGLFRNLGNQFEDNLFVSDFFEWLSFKPAITAPEHPAVLRRAGPPEIVFESVTFAYQGADTPVFEDLSMVIQPGEKIALVGENGAGKTTFVKLLCRFYDPTKGRILIDGVDLRELDLRAWHDRLGVLFQEYSHYYLLTGEAVRIGRLAGPHGDRGVERAATRAGAHSFIEQWPEKYQTQLGKQFEGGKEPSVGQWQKLALSRALYRNPNILILDEPTSSIDPEAEKKIFEDLEQSSNNQTLIMISHRFGSVRRADTIYVFEGGQILESGSHDALMQKNARYAELFRFQAERYQ